MAKNKTFHALIVTTKLRQKAVFSLTSNQFMKDNSFHASIVISKQLGKKVFRGISNQSMKN